MMIVMVVIAAAAVMGFAMVSASSLQAQAGGNLKYVSAAEYLAESGGQLAVYYLQNPSACPVAMPAGYYPGQSGVTFGASVEGSADILVSYDPVAKMYTITSVGKAKTPDGGAITKTLTATAQVVTEFKQTAAVTVLGDIRLPSTPATSAIHGVLQTNGSLTAQAGSKLYDKSYYRTTASVAPSGVLQGPNGLKVQLQPTETIAVPTLDTIRNYTGQYTYQGRTYNAQYLSDTSLGGLLIGQTLPSASDAVNNPAGVYWSDHNVQVSGNVTFNGTLIITNGKLEVENLISGGNTFTPAPGFPALVVESDIDIKAVLASLTVNGLVWTGKGLKTGALNSNVTINGAFLAAGNAPIDTGYLGSLTINYVADNVKVPDFSTTNAVTVGIRVVSWSMS